MSYTCRVFRPYCLASLPQVPARSVTNISVALVMRSKASFWMSLKSSSRVHTCLTLDCGSCKNLPIRSQLDQFVEITLTFLLHLIIKAKHFKFWILVVCHVLLFLYFTDFLLVFSQLDHVCLIFHFQSFVVNQMRLLILLGHFFPFFACMCQKVALISKWILKGLIVFEGLHEESICWWWSRNCRWRLSKLFSDCFNRWTLLLLTNFCLRWMVKASNAGIGCLHLRFFIKLKLSWIFLVDLRNINTVLHI